MSNNPTRMMTDCRNDFRLLAKNAGSVENACLKSERSESPLEKALAKFIRLTVVALRAARALKPEYPSDDHVKTYLHKLVDDVFDDVVLELDSDKD